MGAHSGLTPLAAALGRRLPVTVLQPGRWDRIAVVGKLLAARVLSRLGLRRETSHPSPFYGRDGAILERAATRVARSGRFDCILFTSVEEHFARFAAPAIKGAPTLIGITHQPPGWWKLMIGDIRYLAGFDALVALSTPARAHLQQLLPDTDVRMIRHGVDGGFFAPAAGRSAPEPGEAEILVSGQWLRDFALLEKVARMMAKTQPGVRFRLVLPRFARTMDAHFGLAQLPNVSLLADLSDEDLRAIYHRSHLLFMPLIDATANNAVLEAMATGLPVVVNAVGGIADYVDSTSAVLFDATDERTAVAALLWSLEHYSECQARAAVARRQVETELDWRHIALQIEQAIRSVAARP